MDYQKMRMLAPKNIHDAFLCSWTQVNFLIWYTLIDEERESLKDDPCNTSVSVYRHDSVSPSTRDPTPIYSGDHTKERGLFTYFKHY